ncbi:MAG: hypothetical protein BIFFINMI_01267 [Phycisphaerae bacterium]|nr:hypothetical protein [Phycisphaerae bacterium]
MNCQQTEEKLTAFALEELPDAQRRKVQAHLADCEACRAALADICATADLLREGLAGEPPLKLTDAQRALIELAASTRPWPESVPPPPHVRALRWLAVAAAAACLMLSSAAVAWWGRGQADTDRVAANSPNASDMAERRGQYSYDDVLDKEPRTRLAFEGDKKDPRDDAGKSGAVVTEGAPTPGPAPTGTPQSAPPDVGVTGYGDVPSPVTPPAASPSRPTNEEVVLAFSSEKDSKWARRDDRDRRSPLLHFSEALTPDEGLEKGKDGKKLDAQGRESPKDYRGLNAEEYDRIVDNPFLDSMGNPLSTFSIDVDTASYSNVRRYLTGGQLPPHGAVRIEELINYFHYDYPPPDDGEPFAASIEIAGCPWDLKHRLARIGIKGRVIPADKRPATSLVFLLDVSGSMDQYNKLPLVIKSMKKLVGGLGENDRVAIVVYAGAAGQVLPSTTCDHQELIVKALDGLHAGGSTAGGAGIQLAYKTAVDNFIKGGVNRVILCTDGDFNVGVTDRSELLRMIESNAKSGVFLTVLGFGMGNVKDATLEQLADKGNGNYGYIDNEKEAEKLFVEELSGTLVTIAKDVKIQVEFNPKRVVAYRLIGYENRMLRAEDFNDDTKDAGEIGAGHTVTALYEIVPVADQVAKPVMADVDPLKYQKPASLADAADSDEMLTLKLRAKEPDGEVSKLTQFPARDGGKKYGEASRDFKFAASVAAFGMLLRDSQYAGTANWDTVIELAGEGKGDDARGRRAEFIDLAKQAKKLSGK